MPQPNRILLSGQGKNYGSIAKPFRATDLYMTFPGSYPPENLPPFTRVEVPYPVVFEIPITPEHPYKTYFYYADNQELIRFVLNI
jgi:hypothetical protein